jgi:hypothetical protein
MNILTDGLPSSVKVGNTVFEIETDFRAGVAFSLMAETGEENFYKLCEPFFAKGLPRDINGAIEAVIYFFRGGEKTEDNAPKQSNKPVYSFRVDSEAIYADFWRYYNLDLAQDVLHWWTFRSLLMGLPEESNFKKRIYYRTCELKDLPKKEQRRIAKIRKEIEIKTVEKVGKLTLEQRNKQMIDYVTKRSKELRG